MQEKSEYTFDISKEIDTIDLIVDDEDAKESISIVTLFLIEFLIFNMRL